MSSPRYRWWGFVRWMIRDYPALKKAYEQLHEPNIAASASRAPGVGDGSRSTVEELALLELAPDSQKAYDAVTRAVEVTGMLPDGETRLELIRQVYWQKQQRAVKDAAAGLYISERTAARWHGEFVRLTAKCYGFTLKQPCGKKVGTPEPKKRDTMSV